jgi:hypothetical protein
MSESEDDWARDDIPDLPLIRRSDINQCGESAQADLVNEQADDDEDAWHSKHDLIVSEVATIDEEIGGEPMIIVDMTTLSKILLLSEIHSKFDPNSVNDTVAVKTLRSTIERDYVKYSKNNKYLANGTILPCGSSVWRPALIQLRKERPGHYFCPIFQPK